MEHSVEVKNTLCIICLDPLNDSIINACDTCEVKCHIKFLKRPHCIVLYEQQLKILYF